jgi:hypothetical protein
VTTRQRHQIQALRSKYPKATEDLKFVPTEILIRKYGYPAHIVTTIGEQARS